MEEAPVVVVERNQLDHANKCYSKSMQQNKLICDGIIIKHIKHLCDIVCIWYV